MEETVKTVNASCGQLSQHGHPEASRSSLDSYRYQVSLGNASVHVLTGQSEPATGQGSQRIVSPCSYQSALSTSYCYPKDKHNSTRCGETQLPEITNNINEDQMGACQLSKQHTQTNNREQLQNDDNTGGTRVDSASVNYNNYNSRDNAYCRPQQWTHISVDVGPNSAADGYQDKALDLSGRSTNREESCHDMKCQPTSVNNVEAANLFARSKVPLNDSSDVPNLSGFNKFRSQQPSDSDTSLFKPYSATLHSNNGTLRSQNTQPTQLETETRNVHTIHRPIPIYPQPGRPLMSDNLIHIGAHLLQSPVVPSNYQVGNSYTNLLHQFQNSTSVPWHTQGNNWPYKPGKVEYNHGTEHHFSCFSNDPNKSRSVTPFWPPSMGHNNQPIELGSERMANQFSFPNASQQYATHDEQFLVNHMLWMNAFRNAHSVSTSNSEISPNDGINISNCGQLHYNYSSHHLMETASAYRENCYKRGNIPTSVRTQSWINADTQFRDHAFIPVYNSNGKQYSLNNALEQPDVHEQSVQAHFNKYVQSSSLPLNQDGDTSAPVDLRKSDDMVSFSLDKNLINNLLKNSSCEDALQATHSINNANNILYSFGSSKNKSYRKDNVTRVNRSGVSYTHNEKQQATEFRKVFTHRPQSSNKRKQNCVDADSERKVSRQRNIATLVHVTKANNPSNITQIQARNAPCYPIGKDVHSVRNCASLDGSDAQYFCVSGQTVSKNVQHCSGSQLHESDKQFQYEGQLVPVSGHTLQCANVISPSSSAKHCHKWVAGESRNSRFNSFTCSETDQRNYYKCRDRAKDHKNFKKALGEMPSIIPTDKIKKQNSTACMSTISNCSTAAVCTAIKDQKSHPHSAQRDKHVNDAENLVEKLTDTHKCRLSQRNSVKTESPSIITKDIQTRNVPEQLQIAANSNIEEHIRAMYDNIAPKTTKIATHVTVSKPMPAKTNYCTQTTTTCSSVIFTYPCTLRGAKKKTSREDAVGNKAKLFKCKECNSSHRSFSALLQHQSRGCESTKPSSTPVHATDCVGSYMRYDTTWVGDKCQCTPCPMCKGIFGSKFRVFSHLQRGCYKEKVLRCKSDLLGSDGCKSTFTKGRKAGKCRLQCCLSMSQAEKIHNRAQSDFQCLSSKYSNMQYLYQPIIETTPHIAFNDNSNIKQMPHSNTAYQQTPYLANCVNSSVPILNTNLSNNLLNCTLNEGKYLVPQILGSGDIANTDYSHSGLPAPSVITDLKENATICAPDAELKAPVITDCSNKTNELPYLEQFHGRLNPPAAHSGSYKKCDNLVGDKETDAKADLDDEVKSHVGDNTEDNKTINMSHSVAAPKPLINDKICVSKKTHEIKMDNRDTDVKQEIEISAESATMMNQPETTTRIAANSHRLLSGYAVAMINENVKSDALEGGEGISGVTCTLDICDDVKQYTPVDECLTHKLYRTILGTPVMSLRDSLLNDSTKTTEMILSSVPACPSAAYVNIAAGGISVPKHPVSSSDHSSSVGH